MAKSNDKGIYIDFGLDTTNFRKEVKNVLKEITTLSKGLSDIDKQLKFDPKNVDLLKTKFSQLQAEVKELEKQQKLWANSLEEANKAVEAGKLSKTSEQYRTIAIECSKANLQLQYYAQELENIDKEINGSELSEFPLELSQAGKLLESIDWKKVLNAALDVLKTIGKAFLNLMHGYEKLMKQGIEYNAQMQSFQTVLHAIGDDGEDGASGIDDLIKSMKSLGRVSSFSTSTLLNASQQLLASGIAANDVNTDITNLAKLLAYAGKGDDELQRMAQNLNQIQNAGKATAQDLKQFAYAGVPVYKLLADYSDEFKEITKDTRVEYEDLVAAFAQATEEGGKYFSALEINAQTYTGQVGMMKSNWQELLGVLAQDTSSTLTNIVLPTINGFLSDMLEAFETNGLDGVITIFKEKLPEVINTITESGIIKDFLEAFTVIANTLSEALEDEETQESLRTALETILNTIANFIETNADIIAGFGVRVGTIISDAIEATIDKRLQETGAKDFIAQAYDLNNGANIFDVLFRSSSFSGGGGRSLRSLGFGALQSGGFNSTINANFTINNQGQPIAKELAYQMVDIINEELGKQF